MTRNIDPPASSRIPPLWTLGPLGRWAILVAFFLVALLSVLFLAAPSSWWHSEWAPARNFQQASLESVIADLEATGVLHKGSTYASDHVKHRTVTIQYAPVHPPHIVIEFVAAAAGVVVEAPARAYCLGGVDVAGPAHIRPALGSEPNVAWQPLSDRERTR